MTPSPAIAHVLVPPTLKALTLLRTVLANGYYPLFYIHTEPAFASMRDDPAFRQLITPRE